MNKAGCWKMLPLVCLLCACLAAQAQGTFVAQNIDQNTRWTKAGSPYTVTVEIAVLKDAMLTIEPGVEVRFSPETRIVVEGGISAQGTKSKRISFEGLNGCAWNGFLFTFDCMQYDPESQAGCVFEYCTFKGTGDAPAHLIRTRGCNLRVANCTVEECYTAIQSERQAHIFVENNSFKNCNRPVNVRNTSEADILHNKMQLCNSVLLGGTTQFKYNKLKKFTGTGRHSGVIVWMLGGGVVEIAHNDFVKFEDAAVKLQKMSRRSTLNLHHNNFKDNEVNLKLSCKYYNHGKTSIEENNFYNYKSYHVRLFAPCHDEEFQTCTLGNNYWGKASEQSIKQATFDQEKDAELSGTVQYSRLSSKAFPVQSAGGD